MARHSAVESFVAQPAMALVGLSRSGKKFGNLAYRELCARGYRVYAVHPDAADVNGTRCFGTFADLPEHVEAAVVIVPPARALSVIREAAAAGIRQVWLQQGAESPDAIALARELKVHVITGECILMFARPKGFHKVHRWIAGMLGKLPHD